MLLTAVIIILREVIEASLIISLFLAFSHIFLNSSRWLIWALLIGTSIAILYALNINIIADSFDGVGLEVVNAGLQLLIYLVLLVFITLALQNKMQAYSSIILRLIITGVSLTIIREGTEVIVYLNGFLTQPELLTPVLVGSFIGALIGVSVGILFYYLLIHTPLNIGIKIGLLFLFLMAGSMAIQAVQLLMQADWIASQYPIWNSSPWLSERSIMGQLLYALAGYEATPTAFQVIAYVGAIALMALLSLYVYCIKERA